jgi:single-stranded DNA-binding protein
MTILKLNYAGRIHKAEHKTAGDKQICEVSICKKVPARGKDEERFDWVRVTIWGPPEWAVPKLAKGNYISGSGDLTMRPYEKDGVKKNSLEVRCGSFDFEVEELAVRTETPADVAPVAAPRRPAPVAGGYDDSNQPPFMADLYLGA